MIQHVFDYLARLASGFGNAWTRFWFTPSDSTTLSAIRLLAGVLAVYLHATLMFDLVAFFGPDGYLPVDQIQGLQSDSVSNLNFSYLNYLRTPAELWAIHLLGLAVLLLFAAGFKTRVTSILALVVFLSDVQRAPMISGRTESVLAFLLLYLCIGESGRWFSLDARLTKKLPVGAATPVASTLSTTTTIAIRLIQVHLCLLVALMGFSKLNGDAWWSGEATWWLISRQESRLWDFSWLHSYPKLIDAWTHGIVAFELLFPVLIWVPLARPLMLFFAALFWCSLAIATGEVTFALALGIAALAFVPSNVVQACCGTNEVRHSP